VGGLELFTGSLFRRERFALVGDMLGHGFDGLAEFSEKSGVLAFLVLALAEQFEKRG